MAQEHRALRTLCLMLAAAALLGGCLATRPIPPSNPSPAAPSEVDGTGPLSPSPLPPLSSPHAPPPRENHLSPASHSLVRQARTLLSQGDLDGASSTLDRALHIEPNNPLLWIELGRLRLAENNAHQAEGCGRKALALASGDAGTQAQAGRLLAESLRAQHRNQEAIEIERQPFMR